MFYSIIVPLYNRPQEIKELLESLTQQTYAQFEVLVIEDGSTKDAADIVNSFADKLSIKYFVKPNTGQGFSRNYGFERAKGDYFIVFDSDCLIPEDYLQIVNDHLNSNWLDAYGGPDAAHPSFTPTQKAISYSMTSPFTTGGIRGGKKGVGKFQPRSFNMGISRQVWEKSGGFISTNLGEDIEYSIKLHSLGFKVGLIPDAKVYHKRRTSFYQFFRQIHAFGRGRIKVFNIQKKGLKPVHFLPAMFTLGLLFTLISNLLAWPIAILCNYILAIIIMLIFFHAWWKNNSVKVAFLSVVASLIQLTAYGLGFMQDYWKYVIINRS